MRHKLRDPHHRPETQKSAKFESPDPRVEAWLIECAVWFQSRYGKFAEPPRIALLDGEIFTAHREPILGTTGSSLGISMERDILLSPKALRLRFAEFFTTFFHELHEYRDAGGVHFQHPLKTQNALDQEELRTEFQARDDWKAFCLEYSLQSDSKTLLDLDQALGKLVGPFWQKGKNKRPKPGGEGRGEESDDGSASELQQS